MATAAEDQLRLDLENPARPGRHMCRCREFELAREVELAEYEAMIAGRGEWRAWLLPTGRG